MRRLASSFVFPAVAVAAGAIFSASTLKAGVVFDSLSAGADGAAQLSTNGVSSWNYGAQQFNSGANTALSEVKLSLFRTGTGGTYSIQLWSNTVVSGTAVPGSLLSTLGSGSTSSLTTFPSSVTFNPSTAVSSNTDYWVVFDATGVGPGQAYWTYTADASGTGVAGTAFFKTDDGEGFLQAYGEYRGNMSVTAVPEPSTYALAAVGLGLAGLIRARRRKVAG